MLRTLSRITFNLSISCIFHRISCIISFCFCISCTNKSCVFPRIILGLFIVAFPRIKSALYITLFFVFNPIISSYLLSSFGLAVACDIAPNYSYFFPSFRSYFLSSFVLADASDVPPNYSGSVGVLFVDTQRMPHYDGLKSHCESESSL
eukprot:142584_1